MGKIIFWLILAVLAWWLIKRPSKAPPDGSAPSAKADTKGEDERIVKCDTCGVFMPESDSMNLDGKISCRDPQHCAHPNRS